MPTYRHTLGTGKRFHRIHIPRTGGRYFHENIQINKWLPEQVFESVHIEGVEIQHFHRQLYEEHLNKTYKKTYDELSEITPKILRKS